MDSLLTQTFFTLGKRKMYKKWLLPRPHYVLTMTTCYITLPRTSAPGQQPTAGQQNQNEHANSAAYHRLPPPSLSPHEHEERRIACLIGVGEAEGVRTQLEFGELSWQHLQCDENVGAHFPLRCDGSEDTNTYLHTQQTCAVPSARPCPLMAIELCFCGFLLLGHVAGSGLPALASSPCCDT